MNGCCVDKKYGTGCTPNTCMDLPDGKTCADCAHLSRCLSFGFTSSPERTSCDFFPRRFRLAAVYGPARSEGT